jgi:hypothetical protein
MLYEVLGDIWVVQRNPYLQDDLLDNPTRRKRWSRRCTTAWARSKSAARPAKMPSATALVAELLQAARSAVGAFDAAFEQGHLRKQAQAHWAA